MKQCEEIKTQFSLRVPCCDDCHPYPHRMHQVVVKRAPEVGEDVVAKVCCIVSDALEEADIT